MTNILSLPLEVFEMVVGAVSFVDLPHFLQTCRQIKSDFQATRYHRQLVLIPPEALKDAYEDFLKHPKSWSHWPTHNILSTLSSPYCENPKCGDFGQYFLWCSVPALRLCESCLELPRYRFIRLRDAIAQYGLKRNDIASLPKLKCPNRSNFSTRPSIILHHMFIPASKQDEMPDIPIVTSNDRYVAFTLGTRRILRTFEPKAGGFFDGLICAHCAEDPEFTQRCGMKRTPWIPRNYTSLREHIAKHHIPLLESFEQGWKNLTPNLKTKFHDPISNRMPACLYSLPPEAMRFYTGNLPFLGVLTWFSWTHFAYTEFSAPLGWVGPYDALEKKIDHESSLFGVPPNPTEYEDFPKWVMRENLKSNVAARAVEVCLARVKIEAMLRIERTLEDEGLKGFKSIMNGESIIEDLAKVSMSQATIQEDE